jgi:hypothetical protein
MLLKTCTVSKREKWSQKKQLVINQWFNPFLNQALSVIKEGIEYQWLKICILVIIQSPFQ